MTTPVAETRRWMVTGSVHGWGGGPAGRAVRIRRISAGAAVAGESELDTAGTPAGLGAAQLAYRGLDRGWGLMGAGLRSAGPVLQPGQALFGVPVHPSVDALPGHAQPVRDLADPAP